MLKSTHCFLLTLCLVFASGCASRSGIDRADKNRFVVEFHATVLGVEKVKFESNVGPSVAVGAVVGALENVDGNKEEILGGAVIGGLFAGILTAIFEGATDGYQYELLAVDGDAVTVILDHKPALVGDCVTVRVSGTVKVLAAPQKRCEKLYTSDESVPQAEQEIEIESTY